MKNAVILFLILCIPRFGFAQCDQLENHPDGKEAALKLFAYRDFVKAEDYEKAFPLWEELYKCCKAGNGNILNDGITMYSSFAENTIDDYKKEEYNLKIAPLMKERAECYGHKIRKKTGLPYYGFRYYELGKHYYKNLKDYEKAAFYFEKSIEADSAGIEPNLIAHYRFVVKKRYKNGEIEYDSLKSITKKLIKICDADTIKFKQTKENLYNELGARSAYYFDCEYIVQKLKPHYKKNKNNLSYDEKMEIIKALKRAKCDETNPFLKEVINDYKNMNCYPLIPDRDNIDQGNIALRDGKKEEAKKYYTLGIEQDGIDKQKRFKGAMRLAKLHQMDKEWEQALKYFNKAKELNPNSGEPYVSIGMLYLASNKNCDGFERQLVAIAAIYQFKIAKKYEDIEEEAKDKIETYSAYLPTDISMLIHSGYKVGQEVTVGCVLKVKAIIRTTD